MVVAPASEGWIIDRRSDLLFIIGGVAVSYVLLGSYLALGLPIAVLWWVWVVSLDGPHVFATLSRTYLDTEERRTRRRLLSRSLGWFLLGPAMFVLAAALGTPMPFRLFLAFASVWAYWHVVRQHYGFLKLYKRKNDDMAATDNRVDNALLYVGLIAPFVGFAVTHREARHMLGLPAAAGPRSWSHWVYLAAWSAVALAILAYAIRQFQRRRRDEAINVPKSLFLLSALSLSAVVFSPWVAPRLSVIGVVIIVTAFHNVQYHAIVWFYHRNRYRGGDLARYGLAPKIGTRFVLYAAAGVAFALAYRLPGCGLGVYPGCAAQMLPATLAGGLSLSQLAQGLLWGFALHHYYLDQRIWRVGGDQRLRSDLKLSLAA